MLEGCMDIDSNNIFAHKSIALDLTGFILKRSQMPVVLCVGCDKVVGDSLAPLVGSMLKTKYNIPVYVYGDLEYNITAQNIKNMVNKVKIWHDGAPIIVVDATLGDIDEIGNIKYYHGGCACRG